METDTELQEEVEVGTDTELQEEVEVGLKQAWMDEVGYTDYRVDTLEGAVKTTVVDRQVANNCSRPYSHSKQVEETLLEEKEGSQKMGDWAGTQD